MTGSDMACNRLSLAIVLLVALSGIKVDGRVANEEVIRVILLKRVRGSDQSGGRRGGGKKDRVWVCCILKIGNLLREIPNGA